MSELRGGGPLKSGCSFKFRYALFSVLVEVHDEHIIVKTSTKTQIIPRRELHSIYAPLVRGESFRELIVSYQQGRVMRRARIFSNLGEPQFERLLEGLRAEIPKERDLSQRPAGEAYRALGAQELSWVAVPLLMVGGILLFVLLACPYLIHGLEGEATSTPLSTLERSAEARASLSAHHLRLKGTLDLDHMIEGGPRSSGYELIAPLYSAPASARDPIPPAVLVRVSGRGDLNLSELQSREVFTGIKRSIFWEGISVRERKQLAARGVDLSSGPFLLELDVSPSDDLTLFLSLLTIMSVLTGGVWWSLKPASL